MLTAQELIIEANKCLINDNPPNAPSLDCNKLRAIVGPEEVVNFLNKISGEKELSTITLYRDKFYTLEYKQKGKDWLIIMKDEAGEVHSIMKHTLGGKSEVIHSKQI